MQFSSGVNTSVPVNGPAAVKVACVCMDAGNLQHISLSIQMASLGYWTVHSWVACALNGSALQLLPLMHQLCPV
jgi:hypothetical protein